jgi:predicted secreted protein
MANIMKIGGPDSKRDTIDTTDLDTTGGYRTFIGGLRDGGSIKLTMKFSRDSFEVMRDDFEADSLQQYEIVLPDEDNTSFEFQGLVTEMPLTIDEKLVMADVTIKISGPITINSGSGS